MFTPEHGPSKAPLLDRFLPGSACAEANDDGKGHALNKIKRKLKNVITKNERHVDKDSIRIIKSIPCINDIVPDCAEDPEATIAPTIPRSELIVRKSVKNLDQPAPIPLSPALAYVYGDPYAPANLRSYDAGEMACENSGVELSAEQEEIVRLLNMEYVELKKHVLSKLEAILCGSLAEDKEDVISLFTRHNDILSAELARGIIYTQSTNEYCRKEMRAYALRNLPDGVRYKEQFMRKPRVMSDITDYIDPTLVAFNEHSVVDPSSIVQSESDLSATIEDPDMALIEMGYKPSGARKKQTYRSLSLVAVEEGALSQATSYRPNRRIHPVASGGMNHDPHTRTVNRKVEKLERTESTHSANFKTSAASIRQRIRSLVGSSKN